MLRQYCVNRVHIVRKILFGIATRRGIYEVTLGAIDVVTHKFAKHCATQLSRLPLLHILWYFSIRLVLVATCFRESINTFNNLHKGFLPNRMLCFRHGNSVYSQAQASFLLLRPTPLLHFLPDTKHYNYFISFTWWLPIKVPSRLLTLVVSSPPQNESADNYNFVVQRHTKDETFAAKKAWLSGISTNTSGENK